MHIVHGCIINLRNSHLLTMRFADNEFLHSELESEAFVTWATKSSQMINLNIARDIN